MILRLQCAVFLLVTAWSAASLGDSKQPLPECVNANSEDECADLLSKAGKNPFDAYDGVGRGQMLSPRKKKVAADAVQPGTFDGWRQFATGGDGGGWFYFPSSVLPVHHVKTGKWLGLYVWAGWQSGDGTYKLGRYTIYCVFGTFDLVGAVSGDAAGNETAEGAVYNGEPYRPNTFPYLLAMQVCPKGRD